MSHKMLFGIGALLLCRALAAQTPASPEPRSGIRPKVEVVGSVAMSN